MLYTPPRLCAVQGCVGVQVKAEVCPRATIARYVGTLEGGCTQAAMAGAVVLHVCVREVILLAGEKAVKARKTARRR